MSVMHFIFHIIINNNEVKFKCIIIQSDMLITEYALPFFMFKSCLNQSRSIQMHTFIVHFPLRPQNSNNNN